MPMVSTSDRPNSCCADELPQATLPSSSTMTTLSGSFSMAPASEVTSSMVGVGSPGGAAVTPDPVVGPSVTPA